MRDSEIVILFGITPPGQSVSEWYSAGKHLKSCVVSRKAELLRTTPVSRPIRRAIHVRRTVLQLCL